jgi:ubiquinone/menaquinone biosynthesis C-methylase UbiE
MDFDLEWDDKHVVPPVMFPDLSFLFRRMQEVTVEQVNARQGERILDVGCGRAIDAVELGKGDWECLGLEPSHTMIGHAKEYINEKSAAVLLVRGIGEGLPFKDGSFDTVMCKGALDHFPHPDMAIREMARVLKPQGKAVIAIANFESLSFKLGRKVFGIISLFSKESRGSRRVWHVPEDHAYKFDYSTLRSMIEPHLKLERAVGISLFFGFPWWGLLLGKLPQRLSDFTLNSLDWLARRMPSLSDTLVFRCTPRQ